MGEVNWKKLKSYLCPLPNCGASLKQIDSIHVCTNDNCDYKISDERLGEITVIRHRKLDPPDFIQELRNQEELNNL